MTSQDQLPRRTALRTIGSLGAGAVGLSTAAGAREDCRSANAVDRYVAVVDRIVDGRHVVLLLEADNRVVDQLVVDVDRFDEIRERDVLLVTVRDRTLRTYQHLPEKPESTGQPR